MLRVFGGSATDCDGAAFTMDDALSDGVRAGSQMALWRGQLLDAECLLAASLRRAGWSCGDTGTD